MSYICPLCPSQEFGQRIFMELGREPPPQGSEVYVGNLPRDIYEDELIPVFSRCGHIYKMRVMLDFRLVQCVYVCMCDG